MPDGMHEAIQDAVTDAMNDAVHEHLEVQSTCRPILLMLFSICNAPGACAEVTVRILHHPSARGGGRAHQVLCSGGARGNAGGSHRGSSGSSG